MYGVEAPPDLPDAVCANCQTVIFWRWESEDYGKWFHKESRSIRCDLYAEPIEECG